MSCADLQRVQSGDDGLGTQSDADRDGIARGFVVASLVAAECLACNYLLHCTLSRASDSGRTVHSCVSESLERGGSGEGGVPVRCVVGLSGVLNCILLLCLFVFRLGHMLSPKSPRIVGIR